MSLRPLSMMARRTRRPMRPKPLMATLTVIFVLFCLDLQLGLDLLDNGRSCNAEMLVEFRGGCGGAEAAHADENTVGADISLPAEAAGGFDGDAQAVAQHFAAIALRLLVEEFPAGQGDDGGADPLRLERLAGFDRERDLGAGGDQRRLARVLGRADDIAAARAVVGDRGVGAQ